MTKNVSRQTLHVVRWERVPVTEVIERFPPADGKLGSTLSPLSEHQARKVSKIMSWRLCSIYKPSSTRLQPTR